MNLLQRIDHYQKVWGVILPHLPQPSEQDAARWGVYPVEAVEGALLRAARRFAIDRIPTDFDVSSVCRYVTAISRAISPKPVAPEIAPAVTPIAIQQ